jgi:hypothetical protein
VPADARVGFGGNDGGQYHTTFDDFSFVERYLDPGWVGHECSGTSSADLARRARQPPTRASTSPKPAAAFRSMQPD